VSRDRSESAARGYCADCASAVLTASTAIDTVPTVSIASVTARFDACGRSSSSLGPGPALIQVRGRCSDCFRSARASGSAPRWTRPRSGDAARSAHPATDVLGDVVLAAPSRTRCRHRWRPPPRPHRERSGEHVENADVDPHRVETDDDRREVEEHPRAGREPRGVGCLGRRAKAFVRSRHR